MGLIAALAWVKSSPQKNGLFFNDVSGSTTSVATLCSATPSVNQDFLINLMDTFDPVGALAYDEGALGLHSGCHTLKIDSLLISSPPLKRKDWA